MSRRKSVTVVEWKQPHHLLSFLEDEYARLADAAQDRLAIPLRKSIKWYFDTNYINLLHERYLEDLSQYVGDRIDRISKQIKKHPDGRICITCLRFFIPNRNDQMNCSDKCQKRFTNIKSKWRIKGKKKDYFAKYHRTYRSRCRICKKKLPKTTIPSGCCSLECSKKYKELRADQRCLSKPSNMKENVGRIK